MIQTLNRIVCLAISLFPLIILSVACGMMEAGSENGLTPSPAASSSAVTAVPQSTIELPNPPQQNTPLSPLRLWIPPEIGARTEAGAQELMSQTRAYNTIHPNLEIVVEQKPVEGQGGMLNYLQTGRTVAPTIMPDLVAIPTYYLADTRVRDLFHPLEGLIDPEFLNDIYPAPAFQVSDDGNVLGYPFASTGLTHLIYNSRAITETISLTWSEFISETDRTLVFPADSREGATLGLQFYLAEGGSLLDESGQATLETEPLSRALTAISLNKGNLLQSHQMKTLDEAWQYYQLGLSETMWTKAEYLLGRQSVDDSVLADQSFSAVPGPAGALTPLTTSWAWAVTTSDPVRQQLAADMILHLTSPDNLANWTERSQILPAQRSAMELLGEENPYYEFLDGQSVRAQAMPVNETSKVLDVLGDAVFQVLTTENSPSLIAEQAAAMLRQ